MSLSEPLSFARPKSITFTWPLEVSMMLSALMSRWTIPFEWASCSASPTWVAIATASSITREREFFPERPPVDVFHHDEHRFDPSPSCSSTP